ncbi:hypothetical protein QVD17_33939 [Tagetes erecta]|uniref:Uncharacterized protein n=1 Tax=Tagetes erecta TaxID=13708 RepID=A0AAD8K1H3_TARER|nr:hypothetical protein QVD17_33939 [Tagetes erecta]
MPVPRMAPKCWYKSGSLGNNALRHHEEPKGGFSVITLRRENQCIDCGKMSVCGPVPLLCAKHDCVPCSVGAGRYQIHTNNGMGQIVLVGRIHIHIKDEDEYGGDTWRSVTTCHIPTSPLSTPHTTQKPLYNTTPSPTIFFNLNSNCAP